MYNPSIIITLQQYRFLFARSVCICQKNVKTIPIATVQTLMVKLVLAVILLTVLIQYEQGLLTVTM